MPALVISTDATKARILKMLSLGAQGYMTKPFSPEALREELERVLGVQNASTTATRHTARIDTGEFADVVVRVAAQVLETMFFARKRSVTACDHTWLSTAVSVHVSFEGSHRGEYLLSVSPDTARNHCIAVFWDWIPEEMTAEAAGRSNPAN